ncbi:hypothetical protein LUW76_35580 [Actinomadura madurae]|uniref:DUF6801 domain-containing protein n=1 Tax=Actinomadura madurae TaxID=1993 RepID=UPI002026324B|nr:DUF6801 domain-containing protein [Actinomadura madurae]URM99221.1 hypothetical protein LUW76_35580 [Actinomadura madurae]
MDMLQYGRRLASLAATAAVATALAVVGMPGAGPSASADIGAELPFLCTTPTGTQRVDVAVKASAPAAGRVGEPVQPGTVAISVNVPSTLLREPTEPAGGGTAEPVAPGVQAMAGVSGTARLDVDVVQGTRVLDAGWPVFALAAEEPSTGEAVRLTGHGVTSPITPSAPGELAWRARGLTLVLDDSEGAAGKPVSLNCTPPRGPRLGSVSVRGRTPAAAGVPATGPGIAPQAEPPSTLECFEIPPPPVNPGDDPEYSLNLDEKLYEIFNKPERPSTGIARVPPEGYDPGLPYCARGAGFANIKKLGSATPIAAESVFRRGVVTYRANPPTTGTNYLEQQGYVLNTTVPSRATILSLGFMPTTAAAETVQLRATGDPINRKVGNLRIVAPLQAPNVRPPGVESSNAWMRQYVAVRVKDVSVNGTALNVGENCGSGRTLLSLSSFMGDEETGFIRPDDGQTFTGELDIPAFSHCGVGEDLSPLFTASISGSGNYAKIESGPWCRPSETRDCDADPEEPQTWTISPGGDVTATVAPFVIAGTGTSQIRCEAAALRFHLDEQHWRQRFMLAEVTPTFTGCALSASGREFPLDLSVASNWWFNGRPIVNDTVTLELNGILINASGKIPATATGEVPSTSCAIRIGNIPALASTEETYAGLVGGYANGTFTASASMRVTNKTTCPSWTGFSRAGFGRITNAAFAWDPPQNFTLK